MQYNYRHDCPQDSLNYRYWIYVWVGMSIYRIVRSIRYTMLDFTLVGVIYDPEVGENWSKRNPQFVLERVMQKKRKC